MPNETGPQIPNRQIEVTINVRADSVEAMIGNLKRTVEVLELVGEQSKEFFTVSNDSSSKTITEFSPEVTAESYAAAADAFWKAHQDD